MKNFMLISLLVLFVSSNLAAEELSETQRRALKQTQDLLNSPTHRENYLKQHGSARQVDDSLTGVTGGNNAQKQGTYELSSSIFATIVHKANGDPEKMKKIIFELQRNPESMKGLLTPAQREQLRQLASDIEKNNHKKN